VDEQRYGFRTYNDAYASTFWKQSGAHASIFDGVATTLLQVGLWGGVREIDNHQAQVYSISGTVRWSLWYAQTYTSGTVSSGGSTTISYPHWTAWIVAIWQADASSNNMGVVMCKENDGMLGCISLYGGVIANVGNGVPDTLLDIRSIGGVRDTGKKSDNRRVVVYANSNYDTIEWGLWHAGSYTWGEARPGGTSYATFPHAKFFMMIIARGYQPRYSEGDPIGVLLCREDNDILGCITLATGTFISLSNGVSDIASQIGALGGVRDIVSEPLDPTPTHIGEIYAASSNTAVEGAVWREGSYVGRDTAYGGRRQLDFPHYTFFVFVAARYDKLIWLFCKENDNLWGCSPLRWFQ